MSLARLEMKKADKHGDLSALSYERRHGDPGMYRRGDYLKIILIRLS